MNAIFLALALLATQQTWTPDETMKVKALGDVSPSPDGRRVAYSVTTPVMTGEKSELLTHLWIANADGSEARAFTSGDKSSTNPQWSADGKAIFFTSKRGEHNNLWRIRLDGGEAEQLTDVKSGIAGFLPSPDGQWVAFLRPDEADERAKKEKTDFFVVDENFKMTRLWVIPIEGKREPRLLTKGSFSVDTRIDWSPDSKTIAFSHVPTPKADDWTRSDISLVDVATGDVKPLARTGAAETQPMFSPDGRAIAFAASDIPPTWPGDSAAWIVPAAGGEPRKLAPTADHRPILVGWSSDSRRLYYQEARGTITRLSALPVDGGAPVDVDAGDRLCAFSRLNSRGMIGFVAQDSDRAPEAFVSPLDRFAPAQVSRVNGDFPEAPRTELVRWKSTEGLEIEGLLTYPVGWTRGRKCPLILSIHGGPAGVFTRAYTGNRGVYPLAAFAARGYAILRPNPRGSSGYGKEFRYANRKDWGGGDYRDLMAGVDHVVAMGVADPERLGVMGWSYGGFMTSWTITQTRRFKAASVGAGVTNLMSFNGTADIPSFVPDYFGAESWEDLDLYKAHSAMFQVKGVTTPTLILHGENDVRVPVTQGYELHNALKRQNVPVKMVVYPRQGHSIQEPKFVLDVGRRLIQWFDQYLGPGGER
jgi:dipeptidyl aminopeptidase/acylaminoacyl peptidase